MPCFAPEAVRAGTSCLSPALVVLAPEGREAVYLLHRGSFVLGRDPAADLYIADARVSWKHASFSHHGTPNRPAVMVEDHGSTNGTWINGYRLSSKVILRDRDVVQIGSFVFAFSLLDELQLDATVRLVQQASTDALTALLNRGAFERELRLRMAEAYACGWPVSLMVLDVDHFKRFNDSHGHAFGDRVLQRIAARVQLCVRTHDAVGRVGGEEFAAVLGAAPLDESLEVAERVRQGVADDLDIAPGHSVTVSVGVATIPAGSTTPSDVALGAADCHMYRAKAAGRNCVRGSLLHLR